MRITILSRNNTIHKTILKLVSRPTILQSLLFLLFVANPLVSQQMDDAICLSGGKLEMDYRKKPWKGDNQFLQKYLEEIKYSDNKDKIRYLVPVKFWVYRSSKGTGGASLQDIKQFMTDLNQNNANNQTGIQFYIRELKYINRTARQVFGYYFEAPVQTVLRHTKPTLNVYLVDRFKKKQESKRLVKGTYNIVTKSVIIQRENSSTALTHEIGHYFGLLHPHRHYNQGKSKQEPVSRTRTANDGNAGVPLCELHGDLLSDTPAEPKLTFLVDNNCNFIGNVLKDAWGDNYKSNTNNIMSYPTHVRCRDSFTLSQKAVMLYSASVNKYAKYWNTENSENHKYFFDKTEPNDFMEMAGSINKDTLHHLNFHKIFLKPQKDISDTTDWLKFEVKAEDKKNVRIDIVPAKNNIRILEAILYDKNKIQLSRQLSKNPTEQIQLSFNNVVSDWYYLKITNPGQNNSEHTENYSVNIHCE